MHKPLLPSNKLHFWVSWHFMMVWLAMVRKVSKKPASVRKMTAHWKWSILQKCANLNKSARKTHQFSASSSIMQPGAEMLPEGLVTAQISKAFKLLGYLPLRIAAHLSCSGHLFSSAVRRVYWTGLPARVFRALGMGSWSPHKPPSRMAYKELCVSILHPGYWPGITCLMWPWLCDHWSLGSQLLWRYSCKFMAEHHEIVQKFWPHFEPVGFKNLEKKILF